MSNEPLQKPDGVSAEDWQKILEQIERKRQMDYLADQTGRRTSHHIFAEQDRRDAIHNELLYGSSPEAIRYRMEMLASAFSTKRLSESSKNAWKYLPDETRRIVKMVCVLILLLVLTAIFCAVISDLRAG